MRYLLFLAALSAIALGQSPQSGESAPNQADRMAALAERVDRLTHPATSEHREDEVKNGMPTVRPSFTSRSFGGRSSGR